MFAITVPTRILVGARSATASSVSVTGMSSSRVTRWTTVVAERSTRMIESAWLRIGPILARPGDRLVHVEELRDPAGRRGVEHDRVVRVRQLLLPPPDRLVHLAGEQHVPQAGSDRGGEVDRAEPVERSRRQAEVVEGLQVLQQGVLGVDGQAEHLAAVRGPQQPALRRSGQR